jgi:hypothetical protein
MVGSQGARAPTILSSDQPLIRTSFLILKYAYTRTEERVCEEFLLIKHCENNIENCVLFNCLLIRENYTASI